MGNVFPKGVVLFVPFPMVVAETLANLTEAEIRLYTGLLVIAQKHTATKLHLPLFVLHDYTNLHAETIAIARRKLEKRNLIRCGKGASGVRVYELLNPLTGEELPAPVSGGRKFSGIYIFRSDGRSSRTARSASKLVASPPAIPPTWEELNHPTTRQSVSMTKPIRNNVTDRLVSGPSEEHEKAKVSELRTMSSEIPIRKEVLNRSVEEASSSNGRKVKVAGGGALAEKQGAIVPSKTDRQMIVENCDAELVHRSELEPVIRRMQTVFGARIVGIIDYQQVRRNAGKSKGEPTTVSGGSTRLIARD